MWTPRAVPATGGHAGGLQRKIVALEMLLRYVQPLPDGHFCRNVIRAAIAELVGDRISQDVPVLVWAQIRSDLPDCEPGVNCC